MSNDSINDEILEIKRALAAKFDNDLARIVADAQSREHNTITLPPRRWKSEHLIDAIIRDAGFIPPTICTPEQLLEASDDS